MTHVPDVRAYLSTIGKKGGFTRAQKMSQAARSQAASKAATIRWNAYRKEMDKKKTPLSRAAAA